MNIFHLRVERLSNFLLKLGCLVIGTLFFTQDLWAQSCPGQRESGRPKIVGGNKAKLAHWPSLAVLRLHNLKNNQSVALCGSAVIAPQWVLTAAHCFTGFSKRDSDGRYAKKLDEFVSGFEGIGHLQMVIGTQDLDKATSKNVFEIERIIVHEGYTSPSSGNDIALVKLKSAWTGALTTLSSSDQMDQLRRKVWVAGFGDLRYRAPTKLFQTSTGGILAAGSATLREVRLPLVLTRP